MIGVYSIEENRFSIKAGGPAGKGIFTIGELFAKTLHSLGLWTIVTKDYPSIIKGGHNTITVRAEPVKIYSDIKLIDLIIALDKESILRYSNNLSQGGAILADFKSLKMDSEVVRKDIRIIDMDVAGLTKKAGGPRYENTVLLGAACALFQIPKDAPMKIIERTFLRKGKDVVDNNHNAFTLGYDEMNNLLNNNPYKIRVSPIPQDNKRILVTGNDAASIAAVKAGVKFVAEYPMTPSSSFLHFMASKEESHRIVVKQTEDEIAAINMIIGASIGGVRVMTATSGGGFALMSEGLGFGALCETPLVIFESMRTGPSTGMPTYTEQADLDFVLHAGQGEFPRIIVAPGDVGESFEESFRAFNLAEQYQVPVIVLLDKHISDTMISWERFNTNLKIDRGFLLKEEEINNYIDDKGKFLRHKITDSGISPRSRPGQKLGMFVASSYEHDETGYTTEEPSMRNLQVEKRFRKLDHISDDIIRPKFYGAKADDADFLIVSWGSNKGAILEAMKFFDKENIKARFMHILYPMPIDSERIRCELEKAKRSIIVEVNYTGQMRKLIRQETGILIEKAVLKYDGRPYTPWELRTMILEELR
ncbi:MAG: 2-oxoacid:acceptor oxidoreductase subunit alpha [Candidatus Woesearchaeota archaeon]